MRARRGFALIGALWLLVALSAVGLQLSLRARDRRLAAANVVDYERAGAVAAAGVEHARARLARALREASPMIATPDPDRIADPWRGADHFLRDTVALGPSRYRVTLRDANAFLNVNRASEDDLRRFFIALRVDAGRADRLAQAIADWRDADDLRRARGAERDDYLSAGAAVLPANAPFERLAELLAVRAMTRDVYELARPYLTLVGGGQINLNAALRPVLLALPGFAEEAVAVLERTHARGRRITSLQELSRELSPGARAALDAELPRLMMGTTFETREVELRSDGWTDGGTVRSHVRALLVRSGEAVLVVWRRSE